MSQNCHNFICRHFDCHGDVRRKIVEHMKEHQDLYQGSFLESTNPDDYFSQMSQPATWGDLLTLQAAARVWRVNILVLQDRNSSQKIPWIDEEHGATEESNADALTIIFCPAADGSTIKNHYESTEPAEIESGENLAMLKVIQRNVANRGGQLATTIMQNMRVAADFTSRVRTAWRQGNLSTDKEEMLKIDPVWVEWFNNSKKITRKKLSWKEQFVRVNSWRAQNCRWPSQNLDDMEENSLAGWVTRQLGSWRRRELKPEQAALLEKDLEWVVKRDKDPWAEQCAEMAQWCSENIRFPRQTATDRAERNLGSWASDQRQLWNSLELLKKRERVAALRKIPMWNQWFHDNPPKPPQHKPTWDELRRNEKEWRDKHGGEWYLGKRKRKRTEDEEQVASWLARTRRQWRSKILSDEQINSLWEDPKWKEWLDNNPQEKQPRQAAEERFEDLQDWRARHRRWPDRDSKDSDERSLANWVRTLRRKLLNDKRISERLLDVLKQDPEWSEYVKSWEDWRVYEEEWRYLNGVGWPNIKSNDPDERGLARWVGGNQTAWKNATLGPERESALRNDPLWDEWLNSTDQNKRQQRTWDESLQRLIDWRAQNRRWPSQTSDDVEEKSLAGWVTKQLGRWRRKELKPEQAALLEKDPEWVAKRDEDPWAERWQELQGCLSQKGFSLGDLKSRNKKLWTWTHEQRKAWRENMMPDERVKALRKHEFWAKWFDSNPRDPPQ